MQVQVNNLRLKEKKELKNKLLIKINFLIKLINYRNKKEVKII
jgi:hypothetical protein